VTPVIAQAVVAQAVSASADRAEFIVFLVLAPVSVLAALGMVFNRNAVYSALLLVINFFCLAVFYVLLQAQFLAVVQVIVYAGAVMVLFLFVLMLLGVEREEILRETIKGQRALAAGLGLILLAGVIGAVLVGVFPANKAGLAAANAGGNVQAVGRLLYTRYTLAFEATGVLLLVAGVGALVLGKRRPEQDDDQARAARVAVEANGSGPSSAGADVPPAPLVDKEPAPVGADKEDGS
jgi:NADH-quinone oxidoreductase subunit J